MRLRSIVYWAAHLLSFFFLMIFFFLITNRFTTMKKILSYKKLFSFLSPSRWASHKFTGPTGPLLLQNGKKRKERYTCIILRAILHTSFQFLHLLLLSKKKMKVNFFKTIIYNLLIEAVEQWNFSHM